MSSNQESSSGGLLKWIVDDESNKHNESITPFEREIHERSYHSSSSENDFDAYEDDEALRGVSNAVYRKDPVQSVYSFTSDQLGSGATGTIRAVINRQTGAKFAMKTVNMAGFNATQRERLLQEVFILGRLHHPNIVKLYEVYETSNAMYLIMEMLSGGELYTRLANSPMGKFSEEYTKGIIRQILNAISYLHETKNIAHRDLKLANILFVSPNSDDVKLIDFGLSKMIDKTEYMHSLVGTRYYIAPEVFMNDLRGSGYGKSCDMWSIGVITYFLLTGHNPLPSAMSTLPLEDVQIDSIPFPKRYWGELSPESKSFVQGLLTIDPAKRLTVGEALNHEWFKSFAVPHPTVVPDSILQAIQEFQGYNHLKKAALTAVAYHLNNNDLMKLSDAFEYFDKRNDGIITFEEFKEAMMSLRTNEGGPNQTVFSITTDEAKLRKLFDDIDFEHCGHIHYSEFVGACLARKEGLRREYAELIFKLVDRDHEQFITIEDLHRFFGEDISVDEIEAVIRQTFGYLKEELSEQDLERIMNTKMIANNHTEELVTMQTQHHDNDQPDQSYITVSSIFSRIQSYEKPNTNLSVSSEGQTSLSEYDENELLRRSKALSAADELASIGSVRNPSSRID
ncbi:hypothetical protein WA588_001977, partial [Blastocystis sp. NMH]